MNIVYLHTHDTGRVISPYGYKVHTPNYQAFCEAEGSVLFQKAFSVAPTCSPSRASLLTGVYPHQNGMLGLAQRGFDLKQEMHLANILKKNDYHTALCGVQHEIGYYTDHEMAIGTLGYKQDLSADHRQYSEKELVIWDQENADKVVNFLKNYQKDQPFFVSYGMHATHRAFPDSIHEDESVDFAQPPVNLPNNEVTREDYARYKTSLRIADENIGKVINVLKEEGLYENTIIIVTTDHGLAYPFEKCTLNDEGIGVLLAMNVPGSTYNKKSYDGLISQIDMVPTLCDLIGISQPDYIEGKSFAGIFTGEYFEENNAVYGHMNFHTSYEPVRSVRTKRYKYIRFFDKDYLRVNRSNIDASPIKEFYKNHELVEVTKDEECLYDLYYDTFEQNNLVDNERYQEALANMREKLAAVMKKTNDPLLDGKIEIQPEWKVNKRESYATGSKDPKDYDSFGQ
ncbi:sulfatase [Marinilactibacillus sp. XAAS-LB27]|uniref:sulfatase family protein n=1 Tax=Marinilactibacillus sp. XAAS-LB27 TaxID=3114538 RepID=UPI002E1753DD|nr:sulfatase [Marinilactibacillus sp. XAAS-LB27]